MDCSICCEEITKQSGVTTLSCEHSFHFRCITKWFWKQYLRDLPENCPCCRHEGGEKDRCFFPDIDTDEDEVVQEAEPQEEEEEEEEMDQRIHPADFHFDSESYNSGRALDSVRALFGPLNELEVEESPHVESLIILDQYLGRPSRLIITRENEVMLMGLYRKAYMF